MAMVRFERTARACDLVVDQFKLGAFGGIVFKTLALGTPVLTFLDENNLREQYAETPPVINCACREDVVKELSQIIADPSKLERLGDASRAWMAKYHGKRDTINVEVDQFRRLATAP